MLRADWHQAVYCFLWVDLRKSFPEKLPKPIRATKKDHEILDCHSVPCSIGLEVFLQDMELKRPLLNVFDHFVDTSRVVLEQQAILNAKVLDLVLNHPRNTKGPDILIDLDSFRPNDLSESACRKSAIEVHLPEPVHCMDEAKAVKRAVEGLSFYKLDSVIHLMNLNGFIGDSVFISDLAMRKCLFAPCDVGVKVVFGKIAQSDG